MSHRVERLVAYIFLFIASILLALLGIFLRCKLKIEDFYANIFVSVAASILAGVITALFIDIINEKQKARAVNDALHQFRIIIIHFSLNFCYSFVLYPIKENEHIEPDTSNSMYKLFLDKCKLFQEIRKPGSITTKTKKFYSEFLNNMSFYLKNIDYHIRGAISQNDILHFIDNYIFDLRTIIADIDKLYEVGREDFVIDQIANIIDQLYEIDFIKLFFDAPIANNDNIIMRLYAKNVVK